MSTDQANRPVSDGQFNTIMRRIDELKDTVEDQSEIIKVQQKRISELEEKVEDTSEDHIEIKSDDTDQRPGVSDIWIADHPIGVLLENTQEKVKKNEKEIGKITTGSDGATQIRSLSQDVQSRMLDIHMDWVDVKEGRGSKLNKEDERAAHLFGRFVRRAAGESETSVDPTYNTYSMDSASAADIIGEVEDTDNVASMTVKRAMRKVEKNSEVDGDSVIKFTKNEGKNTIAVDKDKFNAIMESVESAIEGSVGATTDDTGNSVEDATEEIDKELDKLSQATK